MSLEFDSIFLAAILFHSAILSLAALGLNASRDRREQLLWKLALPEAVIFPVAIFLAAYLWYPTTLLATLSYIMYSLAGAFVIAFEVPGFLLLNRFDVRIVDALEETRKDLVAVRYSFESNLPKLKSGWSVGVAILRSTQVYPLMENFLVTCERLKNLDKTFWELVLSEVTLSIRSFSERSKHPFPKLIDILSLAGLSFLLAQALRLLG